uniref:Uncharacterized protein n=1 Tax=Sphenodon punctatus TaxID=8508 RepID=A0A8D0HEV3_SPHPU
MRCQDVDMLSASTDYAMESPVPYTPETIDLTSPALLPEVKAEPEPPPAAPKREGAISDDTKAALKAALLKSAMRNKTRDTPCSVPDPPDIRRPVTAKERQREREEKRKRRLERAKEREKKQKEKEREQKDMLTENDRNLLERWTRMVDQTQQKPPHNGVAVPPPPPGASLSLLPVAPLPNPNVVHYIPAPSASFLVAAAPPCPKDVSKIAPVGQNFPASFRVAGWTGVPSENWAAGAQPEAATGLGSYEKPGLDPAAFLQQMEAAKPVSPRGVGKRAGQEEGALETPDINMVTQQLSKSQVEDLLPPIFSVTPKGSGAGYGVGFDLEEFLNQSFDMVGENRESQGDSAPLSASLLADWLEVHRMNPADMESLQQELQLGSPMILSDIPDLQDA